MYLSAEKKEELFSQYGKSNKDTGSAECQSQRFRYSESIDQISWKTPGIA